MAKPRTKKPPAAPAPLPLQGLWQPTVKEQLEAQERQSWLAVSAHEDFPGWEYALDTRLRNLLQEVWPATHREWKEPAAWKAQGGSVFYRSPIAGVSVRDILALSYAQCMDRDYLPAPAPGTSGAVGGSMRLAVLQNLRRTREEIEGELAFLSLAG